MGKADDIKPAKVISAKEARLKEALRVNLQRRKQKARALKAGDATDSTPDAEDSR